MAKLVLQPGDRVEIVLDDNDGGFVIELSKKVLTINTEWADTSGREGEIFRVEFCAPPGKTPVA